MIREKIKREDERNSGIRKETWTKEWWITERVKDMRGEMIKITKLSKDMKLLEKKTYRYKPDDSKNSSASPDSTAGAP